MKARDENAVVGDGGANVSLRDPVRVVFTPSGRRGSFPADTSVLNAARSLGVDIDSVCGGRGICGRCQIECSEGSFPKLQINSSLDHLSDKSEGEKKFEELRNPLAKGRRLGCQALLVNNVVIDVPSESQVHRQVIRKEASSQDIHMDPAIRLHYVQVADADINEPKGDMQRLLVALGEEWGLPELTYDSHILRDLQPILAEGKRSITVAVHKQTEVVALWPGFRDKAFGAAVDVGSTSIALHLCDLANGRVLASASAMNPQIRFGEDLMSRVSYAMMHQEGTREMTKVIREALNGLIVEAVSQVASEVEDVLELSIVANPIMHHILLGISPVELGWAPFALATDSSLEILSTELGLRVNRGARVYVLPCIAGHVGADAAGMILSEEPQNQEKMTLLVDVGTNAEIILGNHERLVACSSPTGPAFEGAQISCGQRAAAGAIERVRIDRETLEPRFKVIGADFWSDEKPFKNALEGKVITGICGSGIIEVISEMFLAGIVSEDGVIDGDLSQRSSRIISDGRTWSYLLHSNVDSNAHIIVTQNDVRQIQLAKAALYAGIKLLMDHIGCKQIERIRLAGAFGSQIDVLYSMVLGLIPDCTLSEVSSAGNAAGTGALIALLNSHSRKIIENLVQEIEKIETATEPNFQDYFVDAMAFPNKTDPFTNLFSVIDKPEQKAKLSSRRQSRGHRQL